MLIWHTEEVLPQPFGKDKQYHLGIKGDGGITFLTTDNKNRVLTDIDND